MRLTFVLFLSFVLSSTASYAQSPEGVATKFFDAIAGEDYVLAAEVFDSDALSSFRRTLSFLADIDGSQRDEVYAGLFGEGATPESIAQLSDAEYFSAFLRIGMSQMGGAEVFANADIEYLGHVEEAPDVAHLVVRMTVNLGTSEYEKMTVVSSRKVGDQWKMLMSGEIRGLSDQLRYAFGVE